MRCEARASLAQQGTTPVCERLAHPGPRAVSVVPTRRVARRRATPPRAPAPHPLRPPDGALRQRRPSHTRSDARVPALVHLAAPTDPCGARRRPRDAASATTTTTRRARGCKVRQQRRAVCSSRAAQLRRVESQAQRHWRRARRGGAARARGTAPVCCPRQACAGRLARKGISTGPRPARRQIRPPFHPPHPTPAIRTLRRSSSLSRPPNTPRKPASSSRQPPRRPSAPWPASCPRAGRRARRRRAPASCARRRCALSAAHPLPGVPSAASTPPSDSHALACESIHPHVRACAVSEPSAPLHVPRPPSAPRLTLPSTALVPAQLNAHVPSAPKRPHHMPTHARAPRSSRRRSPCLWCSAQSSDARSFVRESQSVRSAAARPGCSPSIPVRARSAATRQA
jgi:hypothetical protein